MIINTWLLCVGNSKGFTPSRYKLIHLNDHGLSALMGYLIQKLISYIEQGPTGGYVQALPHPSLNKGQILKQLSSSKTCRRVANHNLT
jgi:hypothetical protein